MYHDFYMEPILVTGINPKSTLGVKLIILNKIEKILDDENF